MKVKLDDLMEPFEFANESQPYFLNRSTGEIHLIPEDFQIFGDDDDFLENDLPDWEKEFVPIYKDIKENPDNYIAFPDQFDINMYSIMERFTLSLKDTKMRDVIYHAMKGSGAFSRFRDSLDRFGITDEWYKYKDQALRELAVVWCRGNDIEYY